MNQYFVQKSQLVGENELYCRGSANPSFRQSILEKIDALFFRYWLKGARQAVSAQQITWQQWGSVQAVEICVVVKQRKKRLLPMFLDCWGRSLVAKDVFERNVFFRRVRLRNQRE